MRNLSIFTIAALISEIAPDASVPRQLIARALSPEDARDVAVAAHPGARQALMDRNAYRIREANFGDEFRNGGPRGVILVDY